MKQRPNYYSRILSFPAPEPSAAVIELRLCKLLPVFDVDRSAGFDDESLDDFIQRFSGASPSSVLDAFDTLLLKFTPAHSFDSADESFDVPDFDKLYAPFDVIVGGNLITSTRSLFWCDCCCCYIKTIDYINFGWSIVQTLTDHRRRRRRRRIQTKMKTHKE